MRTIIVRDRTIKYKIGRSGVIFQLSNGKRVVYSVADVTGRDANVVERGRWKKTSDGMIRPYDIADFLCKHLEIR